MLIKEQEKCLVSVRKDFEVLHGAEAWRELNRLLPLRNHHFGVGRIANAMRKKKYCVRYWIRRISGCG
jgi:hypothetical protein